jgi:NADH-quinone oxidoreductase subunit E
VLAGGEHATTPRPRSLFEAQGNVPDHAPVTGGSGDPVVLGESTRREITALRDRYPHPRSAILPCLWAVQNELGFLTPEGMAEVAGILNLAPSEVQAVSTFYSMYFDKPAGDHQVLVCVNVSCALRGADDIVSHVEKRLGCPSGGTTADGAFTWASTIECLGACGGAPAMQLDHRFHEDLTPERVDAIFDRVRGQSRAHAAAATEPASDQLPPAGETAPTGEVPPTGETPPTPAAKPRATRSKPRRRPRPTAGDL